MCCRIGMCSLAMIMAYSLSACFLDASLEEEAFEGIILNASSYTLRVDHPVEETKYAVLRPGEYIELTLEENGYTFRAYYAADLQPYATASFHINAVSNDVEIGNTLYDWAVVFKDQDRFWYSGGVVYYP